MEAPVGKNESARLETLKQYRILDTPRETDFDELVRLAALILRTPISLVSLVDQDRQWFKGRYGLEVSETPRRLSFCAYTILQAPEVLEVPDATQDRRFADNELVTGAPHIRFYAGAPLVTPEGHALGTLCVIDTKPRKLTGVETEALRILSHQVMTQLELRRRLGELKQTSSELAALQAQELRLQSTALESVANAIVITDRDGTLQWVNPAFETLTGYSGPEVLGQNLRLLKSDKHDDAFFRDMWTTLNDGRVWHGELVNKRKDGSLYPEEMTITPVVGERGEITHLVAIKQDITVRKEFEANLERQVAERTTNLSAAMRELECFSYTVSHDLRAPLRHIRNFATILHNQAGPTLDENHRGYLQKIVQGAERMGALLDDILALSRLDKAPLHEREVDLNAVVEEARQELASELKGRQIDWEIQRLPSVHGDPSLLSSAMVNLLSNAIKYTRERNPARIEIGAKEEPDEVVTFVRDNGAGFDMQYVDRLFGAFQRLHSADKFEGTGVGLASVRRIIHRHGGRTWAEGEVGRGATFYFSLPKKKTPGSHKAEQ